MNYELKFPKYLVKMLKSIPNDYLSSLLQWKSFKAYIGEHISKIQLYCAILIH